MGYELAKVETHDAGATALAAQATAMIQARTLVAMQRPRDLDEFRSRLMGECKRPGFAAIAIYAKPVGGKKIEGMSVRFAEAALRHLRNFEIREETISETDTQMTIRVTATDLETNVSTSTDCRISKIIERKDARNRQVVSERVNSGGETTYSVVATDDELVTKTGAALSKARRNLIIRLIPGDIIDDCKAACQVAARAADKSDPAAAKKRLYDSFASVGVGPAKLKAYLGHDNALSAAELDDLRAIFAAIRDGETTWKAVEESRNPEPQKPSKFAASADVAPVVLPVVEADGELVDDLEA